MLRRVLFILRPAVLVGSPARPGRCLGPCLALHCPGKQNMVADGWTTDTVTLADGEDDGPGRTCIDDGAAWITKGLINPSAISRYESVSGLVFRR